MDDAAALVTCNPQVAPFKRKPACKRKYCQNALGDLQIQEHLCIKGCRLREFVALPITSLGGVRFTRIASKESWLCELLAGRVCTTEMHHGVSQLKEFVIRELGGGQAQARAATATSLGVEVVALDSSEDDEPAAQPEPPARRRRQMGGRQTVKGVIEVHGVQVTVMIQHRTLWVEANASAVTAMLNQLQRCLVPDAVKSARTKAALGRQPGSPDSTASASSSLADSQTTADSPSTAKPKVYLGNGRYYVSYVNDCGQRTTCSKGLAIRQRDEHGHPWSADG